MAKLVAARIIVQALDENGEEQQLVLVPDADALAGRPDASELLHALGVSLEQDSRKYALGHVEFSSHGCTHLKYSADQVPVAKSRLNNLDTVDAALADLQKVSAEQGLRVGVTCQNGKWHPVVDGRVYELVKCDTVEDALDRAYYINASEDKQ